jgi:predicted heme/steroid binding protein
MKVFSLEELSKYDGLEGSPAFIAVEGKVYDVSDSFLWRGGVHQVTHHAGRDLTSELGKAPHGMDFIEKFPLIGILKNEK